VRRVASRAFSLFELAIVTAIIAIFAAIAIPRFGSSIALRQVEGAALRIAADLELARRHAMTASINQEVRFVGGQNSGYTLVGLTHPDNSGEEYVVSQAGDLNNVEAVSIDFGGDLVVIFDMYGKPDSGGTVEIRAGDHYRTVTLDAETGRPSVSE
jgi:prepilin-type N-terminal cleavage/methylation domain-containing protein